MRVVYRTTLWYFFEKVQHGAGEQSHQQEGNHKAEGVHPDEQKSPLGRAGGHEQHAGQRRTHAGRPGKAEGKAEEQRGQGVHGQPVEGQMEAVFAVHRAAAAKDAQLVQAEHQDQHAAAPGEQGAVAAEEAAQRREAHAEQEEGEADAQHKEQGVDQHAATRIADGAVRLHRRRSAGQIPDIQRDEGQHAGGKDAEQPLQENGHRRDADGQIKSHLSTPVPPQRAACPQKDGPRYRRWSHRPDGGGSRRRDRHRSHPSRRPCRHRWRSCGRRRRCASRTPQRRCPRRPPPGPA